MTKRYESQPEKSRTEAVILTGLTALVMVALVSPLVAVLFGLSVRLFEWIIG